MGSDYLHMMAEKGRAIPLDRLASITDSVSAQVDRAAAIIDHLRQFGRKSEPVLEYVDISQPIRGVFTIIGQQLALEGIEVSLDLAATPPVMAHANRLEQVFFNLVTNARDAITHARAPGQSGAHNETAGPGRIAIATCCQGGRVVVTVADTGCGIAEAERHKIFEPFFTTKKTGQGMGLGLSITYGIVKDYGGDIQVESQPGQGSVFRLSFPMAREKTEGEAG